MGRKSHLHTNTFIGYCMDGVLNALELPVSHAQTPEKASGLDIDNDFKKCRFGEVLFNLNLKLIKLKIKNVLQKYTVVSPKTILIFLLIMLNSPKDFFVYGCSQYVYYKKAGRWPDFHIVEK